MEAMVEEVTAEVEDEGAVSEEDVDEALPEAAGNVGPTYPVVYVYHLRRLGKDVLGACTKMTIIMPAGWDPSLSYATASNKISNSNWLLFSSYSGKVAGPQDPVPNP